MPRRYTVTAALPYANGPIHIGHLAGVYLPADVYARFLRMRGEEVLFVCGSDEGGVAITFRAMQEGISPEELVLKYHLLNKQALEEFGITFDIFSRTSLPIHHEEAQDFFSRLHAKGCLETHTSMQYYDEAAATFLADRYIQGTCPYCRKPGAYGDQCEKCGSTLSPEELIEPVSRLSGAVPVMKETTHWYLPLQHAEKWLREWVLEEHADWKPNVLGQCKSWLDQGLRPRAITRDLSWGVPVPLPDSEGKVLYVWFEAPIGYISATQDWAEQTGKDWRPYWQDPETQLVQFIGKDNIVFHCLIFPTMLKLHGGYILPTNVPANEFMNLEGQKISTSRNHAVWLHEFMRDHPDQKEVLRYVLCANIPETKDSDFTWEDFRTRANSELVAVLGNFAHRTLVLTHKFCQGKVPTAGSLQPKDKELLSASAQLMAEVADEILHFRLRQALERWMELARLGNKYLSEMEPWHLVGKDESRLQTTLYTTLQVAARLAVMGEPFLPETAKKLRTMLGLADTPLSPYETLLLTPGQQLGAAEPLFQKI